MATTTATEMVDSTASPSSTTLLCVGATARDRRTISDVTNFDCQCGHEDCKAIIDKKIVVDKSNANISIAIPLSPSPRHAELELAGQFDGMHVQQCSLNDPRSIPAVAFRGSTSLKRIFFSPHPDDVAYSCFGLVSASKSRRMSFVSRGGSCCDDEDLTPSSPSSTKRSSYSSAASSLFESSLLAAPTHAHEQQQQDTLEMSDSLIVTVFSKSRCANGAIGESLRHCVKDTTTMRAREDQQFARSVGANLVSLNMADTSARDEYSRRPDLLRTRSANSSAQLLSVDHPSFAEAKRRIKPFVELAIERNATIHIPIAVGCHIDHWMVRVAVLSCLVELEQHAQWAKWRTAQHDMLNTPPQARRGSIYAPPPLRVSSNSQGSRLVFYEDLPYAFIGTDDMVQRTVSDFLPRNVETRLLPMTDAVWARKKAAVEGYASQMKPTIPVMLHDHALLLAKRAATLDPRWLSAPSTWTMAERCWVLESVCGPDANLLTSLASSKSEERGNMTNDVVASRKPSLLPATASVRLPLSRTTPPDTPFRPLFSTTIFTSPFSSSYSPIPPVIHIDDDDDDDDDDDPNSADHTTDDAASPLQDVAARPKLRRMSTCPPNSFPIPYHSAAST